MPDPTPPTPHVVAEPALPPLLARSSMGGVLMGLANLVPGISGGTMLLVSGVYPSFINGVAELSTLKVRKRTLAVLGVIIVSALLTIVVLSRLVLDLVVEHRWVMYSLFLGLTLGGVPVLWAMARPIRPSTIVGIVVGIAAMAALTFVGPPGTAGSANGHPYHLYLLAGLAGASAMVLPGISGSYLLLILGQYVTIMRAIADLRDAARATDVAAVLATMHVVVPVGIGVLVGVAGISNLIRYLLAKHEKPTVGLLLGLLLGAVLGLWPFQEAVAPAEGAIFRGDTVAIVDEQLVMATTGKAIEAADYESRRFPPSPAQMAGAAGLVLLGFGISLGVARLGRDEA
ncbi:MAG: DUF368 domain-containing protein [Planctomycetota bacterium]